MQFKTILITSLIMLSVQIINAQNVNIPDAGFKTYLLGNVGINTDGSTGKISVEKAKVFTALTKLDCGANSLASLDNNHY